MKWLKKCPICKRYTLYEKCCTYTENPHPAKFNPLQKNSKYRRIAKGI